MFDISESILYNIKSVADKQVYIFDKHNMAFPVWGNISSKTNCAYTLVTFDYHTDTKYPFTVLKANDGYNAETLKTLKVSRAEYNFKDAYNLAMRYIAWDEQIKTAYIYGYIDNYYIICKQDIDDCSQGEIEDKATGYSNAQFNYLQIDDFLKCFIPKSDDIKIIVDFDMDFFNSREELSTEFFEKIAPILKKAEAITIAKEEWHFNDLRVSEGFTLEEAVELLIYRLKAVLE